jgi:hypothetical protein
MATGAMHSAQYDPAACRAKRKSATRVVDSVAACDG